MIKPNYLGDFAVLTPDKPAVIDAATGERLSYRALDERSNRLAQLLYAQGLRRGDRIAVLMENHLRYFEVAWAAFRSGLLLTALNRFLTADEVAYIVQDSGARAIVSSHAMAEVAAQLTDAMPLCERRLMVDGTIAGWEPYEQAVAGLSSDRLAEEWVGGTLLYTSGTTGRPKGIVRAIPRTPLRGRQRAGPAAGDDAALRLRRRRGVPVHRAAVPRRHRCPTRRTCSFYGGTVVFMRKFDAAQALALIERYRITHSQWVADDVHPAAQAAGRGAPRLRSFQPPRGDPRRRALPPRGQAPHDRMVGADRAGVLRRQRRQRPDRARQPRGPGAPRLGGPGQGGACCASATTTATLLRGRPGRADLFRARDAAVPLPQRPREDARGPAPSAPERGRPSATSATWMPTATST